MVLDPSLFLRGAKELRAIARESGRIDWVEDQYQFRGSEAAVMLLANAYAESERAGSVFESGTGLHVFILRLIGFSGPRRTLLPGEDQVSPSGTESPTNGAGVGPLMSTGIH